MHRAFADIEESVLVALSSTSQNILFFCNPCLCALPDALKLQTQVVNKLQAEFQSVEANLCKEIGNQITRCLEPTNLAQLYTVCTSLQKSMDEVSLKIKELSIQNNNLQMEIDTTSESLSAPVQPKSFASSASSNAALSIADELADRERRKKNIVVYNLTECSDRKTDIETFKALSNNVFKLDVNIAKAIRLGPKIANKQRPLLLTFEDIYDQICLLSHSHFLRRYDQYNRIYFAPDRTHLEHVKHKKVVEELKQR